MGVFNTRFTIPGGYQQIITDASANRNASATTLGVVGPAKGGLMGEITTLTGPDQAITALGKCNATDMMLTAWANGAGTIKFVRVGETNTFDTLVMENVGGATYSDVTTDLSRLYATRTLFSTGSGSSDWLYIGQEIPFDSAYFDLDTVAVFSGSGTTLQAQYYQANTGWLNLTTTDATFTTNTLAQSGALSWTAPADWVEVAPTIAGSPSVSSMYWIRVRTTTIASTAPKARMVVENKNALPAYGVLAQDAEHTGSITTGGTTTLTNSGANFTNATKPVQIGDSVQNIADGSTATVTAVTSATALAVTTPAGGVYNSFVAAVSGSVPSANIQSLASGTADAGGSGSLLVDAAVDFVAAGVAPGDKVTNSTDVSSATVISVSVNQLVTTPLTGGGDNTFSTGDTYVVNSPTRLKATTGGGWNGFQTTKIRPGATLTYGAQTVTVTSIISDTVVMTSGLSGGTVWITGTAITVTQAADTYKVVSPVEKALLVAKEHGQNGNSITVEMVTEGSQIKVKLEYDGYEEEFSVASNGTDPILSLISDINTNSGLVTAEDLTGGLYEFTSALSIAMAKTAFVGGADGSATDQDYTDGLAKLLDAEDVGIVVCTEYSDNINSALKNHVVEAQGIDHQLLRVAICAKPDSENFLRVTPTLQTEASSIGFDGRIIYVIQKSTVLSVSSAAGTVTSRAATAAAIAGRLVGTPAADPITLATINVAGIDRKFNRADRKTLIEYGICALHQDANGIYVVRSVTATVNSMYFESSVRRAVDDTATGLRELLTRLYVSRVSEPNIRAQIKSTTEAYLARKVSSPALGGTVERFRSVEVEFNGDDDTRIDVSYQILPLRPINFVFVTTFVKSGTSFLGE